MPWLWRPIEDKLRWSVVTYVYTWGISSRKFNVVAHGPVWLSPFHRGWNRSRGCKLIFSLSFVVPRFLMIYTSASGHTIMSLCICWHPGDRLPYLALAKGAGTVHAVHRHRHCGDGDSEIVYFWSIYDKIRDALAFQEIYLPQISYQAISYDLLTSGNLWQHHERALAEDVKCLSRLSNPLITGRQMYNTKGGMQNDWNLKVGGKEGRFQGVREGFVMGYRHRGVTLS